MGGGEQQGRWHDGRGQAGHQRQHHNMAKMMYKGARGKWVRGMAAS